MSRWTSFDLDIIITDIDWKAVVYRAVTIGGVGKMLPIVLTHYRLK